VPVLTAAAEARLLACDWPGNVRELGNLIQRTLILTGGAVIDAEQLSFEETSLLAGGPEPGSAEDPNSASGLHVELRDQERRLILEALRETGSRKGAAERLGISPRTLRYKLAKLRDAGIDLDDPAGAQVAG
jgi:two-component system response regulator FlrC